MARLETRLPDTLLYAKQNVEETKQRPIGRLLYSTTSAAKPILLSARQNLIEDYTARDVAARALASINPLLAAVIPQQHQIQDALSRLSYLYKARNEYEVEAIEIGSAQLEVQSLQTKIETKQLETLDNIKNLQQETKEKLDELEQAFESTNISQQDAYIYESKQYSYVPQEEAIQSESLTPLEEKTEQVVDTQKELTEETSRIVEELQTLNANIERLTTFLTGTEQFGLAGAIDRIFNKYTALLNRHPVLRGLHALTSTLIKLRLGLTKPASIKPSISSIIKRFLGVGVEESPLQQLVGIASAQLDIQYRILQTLKKSDKLDLKEETLEVLSGDKTKIIDEKIDEIINKIPLIKKLEAKKAEVTKKFQEKVSDRLPNISLGLNTPLANISKSKTNILLENIIRSQEKSTSNILERTSKIEEKSTNNIKNVLKKSTEVTSKSNIFPSISSELNKRSEQESLVSQTILNKISKIEEKATSSIENILKKYTEVTSKNIFPSVSAQLNKRSEQESLVLQAILNKISKIEEKATNNIENVLKKSTIKSIPLLEKSPKVLKEKHQKFSELTRTTPGEFAVGLTSLAFPLAPSLIQLSAGNYKLAARELVYTIPVLGQILLLKNLLNTYSSIKQTAKQEGTSTTSYLKAKTIESIKNVPKPDITNIKQLDFTSVFSPLKDRFSKDLESVSSTTSNMISSIKENVNQIQKQVDNSRKTSIIKDLAIDIAERVPYVKLAQGILTLDWKKTLWGLFGSVFTPIYIPIEAMKFISKWTSKAIIESLSNPLKSIQKIWNATIKTLSVGTTISKQLLKSTAEGALFKLFLPTYFINGILRLLSRISDKLSFLNTIADYIKDIRKSIFKLSGFVIDSIGKGIKTILKYLEWQRMWGVIKGIGSSITSTIGSIFEVISNFAGGILGGRLGGKLGKKLLAGLGTLKVGNMLSKTSKILPTIGSSSLLSKVTLKGGKTLLKFLPGIGTAASLYFAYDKFKHGDLVGAAGEALSGLPVIGPLFTALTTTRDIYKETTEPKIETNKYKQDIIKQKLEQEKLRIEPLNKINKNIEESKQEIKQNTAVVSNVVNNIQNIYQNTMKQETSSDNETVYRLNPIFIKP